MVKAKTAQIRKERRGLDWSPMAWLYLLPAFALMVAFTFFPMVNTLVTSFKLDYRFLTGEFARFSAQHYIDILKDPVFQRACLNTMFIAFVCVPCSMLSALLVSLALHSIKRLRTFLATLYYLPQVTNVIAAGMVFAILFNTNFGLINRVLGWFGVQPVAWISGIGIAGSKALYNQSYARCLFVLFVYSMWQGLSLKVILFLGGLQNINPQYYQAAQVDGTGRLNVLRKITLPLLSPTTVYVFITSVTTAFKAYTNVVSLFGGSYGPRGDNSKMMITIVGYLMDSLGDYLTPGAVSMAGAAAVILMVMVMLLTAAQLKLTAKRVHYK